MAKTKPKPADPKSAGNRSLPSLPARPGNHGDASAVIRSFGVLSRCQMFGVCALLFLLAGGAFLPSLRNGFVDYDDDVYVTANTQVQAGLSLSGAAWTLGSTAGGNYWHPLTWLSHMLDCQLFGLRAWGHHLTSVLVHALNMVLLFVVLRRMTGATWRSLLVATLFGLHPLRVESVAWVAERKDVLSALFWLLTLWAYACYVEQSKVGGPKSKVWYGLVLVCFALGLMCKPMVVTLPFVLLLLDYWPLRRLELRLQDRKRKTLQALVVEKVPLFILAAAVSAAAYKVQAGAGVTAHGLAFGARLGNALIAYCRYLGKLVWPSNLAVLYPHPLHWPPDQVALAALLLLGISAFVLLLARQRAYLVVGWLWFVGTLVPVIGLVQAGAQSMADRYTYLPLIGVLVALVWGLSDLMCRSRYQGLLSSSVAAVLLVACLALTRQQIGYWKNTEALFRHAIAVTQDNYIAHLRLGTTFSHQGRLDEAISELQEALRIQPNDSDSRNNLGAALGRKGRLDEAIIQFQQALKLTPDDAEVHNNLGVAFAITGSRNQAVEQYQEALRLRPDYAGARKNLEALLNTRSGPTK
jgi:Tfp pilus assembly protein PilF